ncbi:MAG: BLUF domain-containing protein [Methylophilaceae bacterium]|nr:BLUF domain-containing protein [Methylophilaceae bacterium]
MSETIYTYVHMSELANDISPKDFSQIISHSRANHLLKKISGILFYDGAHFFQYLEGHYDNILEVISEIEASNQQHNIKTLYKSKVILDHRRFNSWKLGYVDSANSASIFETFKHFINEKSENLLKDDLLKIEQAMTPMIRYSDIL